MRPHRILVPLVLLTVLVVSGVYLLRGTDFDSLPLLPSANGCAVEVDGVAVDLDLEQGQHAGLIAAIGVSRGLPARAVSIALATAFQESKLRNLRGGDRDSIGLFQQRPSQGWGTPRQIRNTTYATNAFYDGLEKVAGYRELRITEAAQEVQRSGFPEAYEQHAEGSRALASALTGYSPAAFSCDVDDAEAASQAMRASGLTPRAQRILEDTRRVFGSVPVGGFAPEGVSTGHKQGSRHYDGRAVDLFVRPVNDDNNRRGWSIAAYLVSQADRLEIDHVIFDAKIWSSSRSGAGWRDYSPDTAGRSTAAKQVLLHRDHVHVDVR